MNHISKFQYPIEHFYTEECFGESLSAGIFVGKECVERVLLLLLSLAAPANASKIYGRSQPLLAAVHSLCAVSVDWSGLLKNKKSA